MDPERISCPPPPPISGQKRQRCPSSPSETDSKRQALSADRSSTPESATLKSPINKPPTPKPCKPVISEDNWYCPNCGHCCWLCKLSPAAPPEQPELGDEEERKRAKMTSNNTPSTTDTSSIALSSKKRKKDHLAERGFKLVGPRDPDFDDHILEPLGVKWGTRSEPNSKPPLKLKSQPLPQSRVMIKGDDKNLKEIMMDFRAYWSRPCDEHALSTVCWDSIILRDKWVENAFDDEEAFKDEEELIVRDQEPIITSVRRDKWKPHKQGPSMPESKFVFDWELEPDTSYAVSIRMFNLEYREKLHSQAFQSWVAEKDVAVCPYLTVEYKCSRTGGKQTHATNQATAAAVLWLYQRKNLRDTIGKAYEGLSHFWITIVDSNYVISEGRLTGNGYIMREQVTGNLIKVEDLRLYIEWSNAIHAWGLGANAHTFKEDIETLVKFGPARTSSNPRTPAGTVSPMGTPFQRPGQSQEDAFHKKATGNAEIIMTT